MKKVISIAGIIVGTLFIVSGVAPAIVGAVLRMQIPASASIGIIGGADGPTAIMVVGTFGTGHVIGKIVVGAVLIIAGILGYRKHKR